MGILSWFDSCSDKEREAARKVIAAGKAMAGAGYRPICDRFPGFSAVAGHSRLEAYDHYYTIAFAIMALIGANMYFPMARRQGTTRAISTELEKGHKGAYKKDGRQLMDKLNANNSVSQEVCLGGWLIDQISREIRDNKYKSALQELKQEEKLMSALGNQIMAQSAESVVDCFLEDKNN